MTESIFSNIQAADAERKAVTKQITDLRRELEKQDKTPKQIQNNPELKALQAQLEEKKSAAGLLTTQQSLDILNRQSTESAINQALRQAQNTAQANVLGITTQQRKELFKEGSPPSFPGGPSGQWVWTGSSWGWEGVKDTNVPGGGGNSQSGSGNAAAAAAAAGGGGFDMAAYLAEMNAINARNLEMQKQANIKTAKETLRIFLTNLFFDSEDAFVNDVIKQAQGDFELGLSPDVILKKMEDYENPNSLFAKRFAGNVELRKQGIEPLSPETYLQQERIYREYLNAVGLTDLATRNNFATLVGKSIAPTELARRIENVFDVWDSADAAYKSELERTLGVSGIMARNEVAKVLLLGKDAAAELQKKVATAGVATEARVRGLDVGSAQQLGAMGITREQARTGFEQIALTQPVVGKLSEIYDKQTLGARALQTELEQEQFQGMQSQRRRRLAEQEQAAFMGRSGTAGAPSLRRGRAGSI